MAESVTQPMSAERITLFKEGLAGESRGLRALKLLLDERREELTEKVKLLEQQNNNPSA